MTEKWQIFEPFECPKCGDSILVLTDEQSNGEFVYDGDDCKCIDCDYRGTVMVDEDGNAYID